MKGKLLSLGGALTAGLAASVCCLGPLVLLGLGISGAWVASLSALEPFRLPLLAIAWALWGWAGLKELRKPATCEADDACPTPQSHRKSLWLMGISGILLLFFTLSPWLLTRFLLPGG